MAVYNDAVVTNAGIQLIRDIALSGGSLNAAGAVTSESIIGDPQTATGITGWVQSEQYSLYAEGPNRFVLELQLTNAGLTGAYELNTIGFYANDGTNSDVLFAVITAQSPDSVPPDSRYPQILSFKEIIVLDNGGNVPINASFAGFASQAELSDGINGAKDYTDQKVAAAIASDELGYFNYGRTLTATAFPSSGVITGALAYDFQANQAYKYSGSNWDLASVQPIIQQGSRVDVFDFLDGTDLTGAAMAGFKGAALYNGGAWQFGLDSDTQAFPDNVTIEQRTSDGKFQIKDGGVTAAKLESGIAADIADIAALKNDVNEIEGFIGYTGDDIYGLEADFENNVFKRLAGAVGRTGGADFDDIACFGGRRRCLVDDNGGILAYYGDDRYNETGFTIIGNNAQQPVQVMVYQPKFYYKVVPLKLERIVGGKGYHLRKARYYVSATQKSGFKVHPAFIKDGIEKDYILIGAYEGSLFSTLVVPGSYLLNDEQITSDFFPAAYKLSSIAGAIPASGSTQNLTRRNCGILAENRGAGWSQLYVAILAATQLLAVIEYGTFNLQVAIGSGGVNRPDVPETANDSYVTGKTSAIGNATGMVLDSGVPIALSYRGEENPWGNIWKFLDGLNIYPYNINEVYVADNDFMESKASGSYQNAGITIAKTNGYISAFGYNKEFDWLFLPSETLGNSSVPVGDKITQKSTYASGYLEALIGGRWGEGVAGGIFSVSADVGINGKNGSIGGRLVYVPTA